jgi:hypothetical protein
MKKRIRQGQYSFPDPEWSNVSTQGMYIPMLPDDFEKNSL